MMRGPATKAAFLLGVTVLGSLVGAGLAYATASVDAPVKPVVLEGMWLGTIIGAGSSAAVVVGPSVFASARRVWPHAPGPATSLSSQVAAPGGLSFWKTVWAVVVGVFLAAIIGALLWLAVIVFLFGFLMGSLF